MTVPLFTAAEAYALEADLARHHGLAPEVLMQRAGRALHACIQRFWPDADRVLVVAGAGNNGGDGYVLAGLLRAEGRQAEIVSLADPGAEPAATEAGRWLAAGGALRRWSGNDPLPAADLIVDALFGVGLDRPLTGDAAGLVAAINAGGCPVLAVDLPSGIDADTGAVAGVATRATRTLCLLARKQGVYTGAAPDHVGVLDFDDLSVPDEAVVAAATNACRLVTASDLADWLPPRHRSAHKGDHGHVLVVGGDHGMPGAVRIASAAALRAGAGWCSVATRRSHAGQAIAGWPEVMIAAAEDDEAVSGLIARSDVIAIGPGLGQGDWARSMLSSTLSSRRPCVLDADALNLVAAAPAELSAQTVITPHPGEAARLLGCTVAEIERDRFATARALATRYRAVAVLKGAGTLIDDGARSLLCPFGNPGMASAGMGDALTGIIAAFLAQGLAPFDAAAAGVTAHALAGDTAARLGGERGLLASDLIGQLRQVVNP